MKVPCLPFLLLTVSCAALMQETSYAASPQHASDENHPHSRAAGLTAANRPKQPPTGQKRPLPRNTASLRQPPLARSGAAEGALIQNETTKHGLPVRLTSVRPSVASLNPSLNPLPNNVRHRGPNAAVVSGSANSGISNTGAISGTGMHRRP
jgi:hypothetical protein